MRYFVELGYRGTEYCGWQIQPNALSVQEVLENAFSTILNQKTPVVGCGRTDTGVHASQYFLHFDGPEKLPEAFVSRLNKFLPNAIALRRFIPVAATAHARFDATRRSYRYAIDLKKNPFRWDTAYYYYKAKDLRLDLLNEIAQVFLDYEDFAPFCKTGGDTKTMRCALFASAWTFEEAEQQFVFRVSANRFLRGMVRLMVGVCLLISEGQLSVGDLNTALKNQTRLRKNLSVPPQGLFLSEVVYDYVYPKIS